MKRTLLLALLSLTSCTSGQVFHVRSCAGDELPLITLSTPAQPRGAVVFLTGDGGWRALDRGVSDELTTNNLAVTGFLADRYFSRRRTIAESACDLEKAMDAAMARTHTSEILLIGYSRGAETIAVALARLPEASRRCIRLAVLLAPSREVSLQRGLFGLPRANLPIDPGSLPVGVPMICFHGLREKDSLCDVLPHTIENLAWAGGHHFGGDYQALGERVVERWRREAGRTNSLQK
jgi:type IV secretory pathway VirJ component